MLFDDAVRENGFDLGRTSPYLGVEEPEWEGLAGVILREEDWFEQWLNGEKKCKSPSFTQAYSSRGKLAQRHHFVTERMAYL